MKSVRYGLRPQTVPYKNPHPAHQCPLFPPIPIPGVVCTGPTAQAVSDHLGTDGPPPLRKPKIARPKSMNPPTAAPIGPPVSAPIPVANRNIPLDHRERTALLHTRCQHEEPIFRRAVADPRISNYPRTTALQERGGNNLHGEPRVLGPQAVLRGKSR